MHDLHYSLVSAYKVEEDFQRAGREEREGLCQADDGRTSEENSRKQK
jgi:hypothetical protein